MGTGKKYSGLYQVGLREIMEAEVTKRAIVRCVKRLVNSVMSANVPCISRD